MAFDIVISSSVNADGSITGTGTITRDGAPFYVGTSTYYGMSPDQMKKFGDETAKFLSKYKKLTGLTYGEMHRFERKLSEHLLGMGDVNAIEKEKKHGKK